VNENGTLEEVQQIAALDGGDWTAVRLVSDHTLIAQLVDSGVVPNGADGPIDLDRDAFVEGIVMGAAQALRSATPHLTTPAPANA